MLAEAASNLPAQYDFVGDGLSGSEKEVMDWADSRLFSNDNFLESRWGPDNWPSDVWTASVQAIPLLMLEIDIQRKANGKHVVTWEVDSLDRVLDGLGIYEGVCISCYGKKNYNTKDEVRSNFRPIVLDPRHVHRDMIKALAYFANADGEGILVSSFVDNDADDLQLLYERDPTKSKGSDFYTHSSFGRSNLSFMSLVKMPGGTVKSFPTMVYEIIGDSEGEREAAERWLGHLHKTLVHFVGDGEDFADIFRPYSQTPYTPEPGYILLVGEAGSPSSTGLATSGFRSLGLKAEHFLSPEYGARAGSVEINGNEFFYDGNDFWDPLTEDLLPCGLLRTLDQVENFEYDNRNCR